LRRISIGATWDGFPDFSILRRWMDPSVLFENKTLL
jgi:hypothetical protein